MQRLLHSDLINPLTMYGLYGLGSWTAFIPPLGYKVPLPYLAFELSKEQKDVIIFFKIDAIFADVSILTFHPLMSKKSHLKKTYCQANIVLTALMDCLEGLESVSY